MKQGDGSNPHVHLSWRLGRRSRRASRSRCALLLPNQPRAHIRIVFWSPLVSVAGVTGYRTKRDCHRECATRAVFGAREWDGLFKLARNNHCPAGNCGQWQMR